MKITVKRVLPLVANEIVLSIQRAALVLIVTVFAAAFLLVGLGVASNLIQPVAFGIGLVGVLAYIASKVFDARLKIKGSYMELTESQIVGESTGFSSNSFTVPISQVATMHIHQDFIDKLFGVSAIVFTQMNSSISVFGFEHSDAQKFVKKFAELQSKK